MTHLQEGKPTVDRNWLRDLAGRIYDLSAEAEERYGDPAKGCYASEVEMLLHMAHSAALRHARRLDEEGPALPPPTREELFTDG